MLKTVNAERIEGRVVEHKLTLGQSKSEPIVNMIRGSISVATDEACLNVVKIDFPYGVKEVTSKNTKNASYTALKQIIESGKTVLVDGKDAATKVRVTPSFGLNEYVPQGQEDVVTIKRNEGGFVTIISRLDEVEEKRNRFEFDFLITGAREIDEDAERGIKNHVVISGYAFDYKNALLPTELVANGIDGVRYFTSLGATPKTPYFTKLRGSIVSTTVMEKKVEASAFGGDMVTERAKSEKSWVVDWALPGGYDLGEGVLTGEEYDKLLADRETHLAEVKKNAAEYAAQKSATGFGGGATVAAGNGAFTW